MSRGYTSDDLVLDKFTSLRSIMQQSSWISSTTEVNLHRDLETQEGLLKILFKKPEVKSNPNVKAKFDALVTSIDTGVFASLPRY